MVVTFGLHFASRYPGSCDLKAMLGEQISGAVGQISLSRPVIPVSRADIRGGWADRLVEACDTRFTSRTFGDLPHWERSAPGRLGRWRCHELCCPDVLQIRRISVPGVGVLAIRSQQRPWHPYRESKLGARETSTAICPQPWQKSQKSLIISSLQAL